ncbi:MAG: hypothetical protein CMM18_01105 [Rhodospirillaceae bacterium]|nr:hypothetical protein [Rhodospirillaceae bacterium]|tara:strand:- start:228 stop:1211 length:984 start_codon:yes stop_codon:yes gene_type:complete
MIKKNKLNSLEFFFNNNRIKPDQIMLMKGDASNRVYSRIYQNNESMILMDDQDKLNLKKFLNVSQSFLEIELSIPKIFCKDLDEGFALMEDFGDTTYTNYINKNIEYDHLYENAIDVLLRIQKGLAPNYLDYFTDKRVIEEVSIFLDWTLPFYFKGRVNQKLKNNFIDCWSEFAKVIFSKSNVITHFDFHIDNLIWLKNRKGFRRVGILDFQDALIGPPVYDLVSLLQDARRDVDEGLQKKLINKFLKENKYSMDEFKFLYDCVGAQRNTRILGVFARLKLRDNKDSYLKHMNRVWGYLKNNLQNPQLKDLHNCYSDFFPEEALHND